MSYDQWKLATPPEYEFLGQDDEDKFQCSACEDIGWLDDNGHAVPCSECSAGITMEAVSK